MIAISTDTAERAKAFKASLKAPYHFVGDEKGELVKQYEVKTFLLPISRRITFVVGEGRKVLAVQEGNDALDPSGAVTACSLAPPRALQLVAPPDGGTK